MRIVLHIGLEKTGTKTIQRFLAANEGLLASQGIALPERFGEGNWRRLSAIFMDPALIDDYFRKRRLLSKDERRAAQARWRSEYTAMLARIEKPTLIISSEHLQSRLTKRKDVESLAEFLLPFTDTIEVVVYLRDPVDLAVSLYSTALLAGWTEKTIFPPDHYYMQNLCGHQYTIERFENAFQCEPIVRRFAGDALVEGDLVEDFCQATGIVLNSAMSMPSPQNQAISEIGGRILSRLNEKIPVFRDDVPNPERGDLSTRFAALFSDGRKMTPTPQQAEAYDKAFRSSNEAVRRRFFPERTSLFPRAEISHQGTNELSDDAIVSIANAFASAWLSEKREEIFPQPKTS